MPGDDSLASDVQQRAHRLLLSLQQHALQVRAYNPAGASLADAAADAAQRVANSLANQEADERPDGK
jgi:hypothetical protein